MSSKLKPYPIYRAIVSTLQTDINRLEGKRLTKLEQIKQLQKEVDQLTIEIGKETERLVENKNNYALALEEQNNDGS